MLVFGVYGLLLFSNVGTFAIYAGDHNGKMRILEDPELSWISDEIPSSLVWGNRKTLPVYTCWTIADCWNDCDNRHDEKQL
ncbi:hypothetical protein PRIPAC_78574 [Pristionchus pacificus]|uniref:Uncharacterized protein n=1 Tax=Pristionchus pacificus TaxID=54126 RepID=A0A2A6C3U9_PRIPA|nr:hypothetical protein PRIPAC_78574 [Pristionchus pacificus]|eukprot:PDM72799.1 hypothetical protein PRIPAC_39233 [Pristionchus pacificus]